MQAVFAERPRASSLMGSPSRWKTCGTMRSAFFSGFVRGEPRSLSSGLKRRRHREGCGPPRRLLVVAGSSGTTRHVPIDLPPLERQDLAVEAPARQVGERHDRTVAAAGRVAAALPRVWARSKNPRRDVVLPQHGDVGLRVQLPRLHRPPSVYMRFSAASSRLIVAIGGPRPTWRAATNARTSDVEIFSASAAGRNQPGARSPATRLDRCNSMRRFASIVGLLARSSGVVVQEVCRGVLER